MRTPSSLQMRMAQRWQLCSKLVIIVVTALLFYAAQFSVAARRNVTAGFTTIRQNSAQTEFFEKQIRPILAAKCQMCHNAKAATSGLDLSTAEGFARGGASGALVSQENPDASLLLRAISYEGSLKMPPMGKLKTEEIAALTVWVKLGAPWPGAAPVAASENTTEKKSWSGPTTARAFTDEEKQFWSFQPMTAAPPPTVKNKRWVKSPVDAFILAELEKKNLSPAPPTDKLTLLRRVTYDLTGLPPTEKEIAGFLADKSPQAFANVVERLLASPRYGEKWGRHWLDVARYADSTGNDEDHRYPYAWRYRDYVIEAFNRDLPYDQFVREQIAGDLLPAPDGGEVNRRGIVATGFLALGAKALAQQDKVKMLYDVYDEQVEVTGKAFLGLTISCARCHNHKFDPILTRDYYSMVGIFASTRSFRDPKEFVSALLYKPLVPKAEYENYEQQLKQYREAEKKLRLAADEIATLKKEAQINSLADKVAVYMLAARRIYQDNAKLEDVARETKLDEAVLQRWANYLKPSAEPRQHLLEWQNAATDKLTEVAQNYQQRFQHRLREWNEQVAAWRVKYHQSLTDNKTLPDKPGFEAGEDRFFHEVYLQGKGALSIDSSNQKLFTADEWKELQRIKAELAELKKREPEAPDRACAVEEGESVEQKVFLRGDYNNAGEDAPKAVPAILKLNAPEPQFQKGSGRLQLAEWLTQPGHPLTWRVMANRLWQWHFGEGIVRTPDNFGKMGERPTHPALLDFLAREFAKSGYSIKAMHRMLLLSNSYQMSSAVSEQAETLDPENRLFSRFPRRRLAVEELRDAMLAIDGTIDLTMGGTMQKGYGTDGENSNDRLSLNPEKVTRRTVYVPLRRANLPSLLNLFDFGDATAMNGKRQLTNVPTQALFAMNSAFVAERANNLTKQLLDDNTATETDRIAKAFLKILNRPASTDDIRSAQTYLAGFKQKFASKDADRQAWQSFCRILLASNEFIYVD